MIYRLSFWKKLKTTFLKPWFESGGCFDFLQQVDDSGLHLVPFFEEKFFYVFPRYFFVRYTPKVQTYSLI